MFSRLFWPEFVEIEGMVLLKETTEQTGFRDRIRNALEKCTGDRSAIERSFNLKETTIHLLGKDLKHTTDEQIDWLEQRLSEMWAARLWKGYPNRQFVVEIVALDPSDPHGETGITFYEAPDDSRK